jgi:AcrR family transcriptional regulator
MARPALTPDELDTTRRRILVETAAIIAAEGYAALSMRRIASAIGLTAGALYRYFPTKQHVLMALWSEAIGELDARTAAIDVDGPRHGDVIAAILEAYTAFALADTARFRVMFLENDLGSFDTFANQQEFFASYGRLRARVERAIRAGELQVMSPDAATHLLWGSVHGIIVLSLTVNQIDFGDPLRLAAAAADTMLRGLSVPPSTMS